MLNRKKLNRVAGTLLLALCMAVSGQVAAADDLNEIDLEQAWGVQPVHLRVTADGYMIEFRYKVLDAEKALILSDRKDFPYLQSMKSRAKLSVPYFPSVGYIKSNRRFLKPGRNYTAMFSNEGRHLLAGDQVRIQVRDQVSPVLTLE